VIVKKTSARVGALPTRRRITLYIVSAGVWLTGAVWLLYHYFIRTVDNFGFENPDPNQRWWLIAHAVFSLAAVWLFGVLWPNHVKKSWNQNVRRWSGGSLFGVILWLSVTGLALYYIGSDDWRAWTSFAHWVPGLAALLLFLYHLLTRAKH
jgi:hypothetical protein